MIMKVSTDYWLCVFVIRYCMFVSVPQIAAILVFILLYYKKAESVVAHSTDTHTHAHIYIYANR